MSTRILPSWIEGFMVYTENISSRPMFRRWTAITMLSGALERKVWLMSQNRPVYPNLYVLLVGPPGTGKTRPISLAHDIFDKALPEHHCAETSLSKPGLVDRFAESHRVILHPTELHFNSLFAPIEELSMFLSDYDKEFISFLTHIYDNVPYREKFRNVHKGETLSIDKPSLSFVAGTTPAFMASSLPITAWDDGFLARVIIAYGEDAFDEPRPELHLLDETYEEDRDLQAALINDLTLIGNRVGRVRWEADAAREFLAWYTARCPWPNGGLPTHPRLQHYSTRRHFHALKLCLIACCDRDGTAISVDDVLLVKEWMFEAEQQMVGIFSAMESGGDAAIIRDAYHFIQVEEARGGCPLSRLYSFLSMRTSAMYVPRIYQNMLEGNLIKVVAGNGGVTMVRAVPGAFGTIRTLPKST